MFLTAYGYECRLQNFIYNMIPFLLQTYVQVCSHRCQETSQITKTKDNAFGYECIFSCIVVLKHKMWPKTTITTKFWDMGETSDSSQPAL